MTATQQPPSGVARTAPWRDTREWIARATAAGELRVVTGASWQEEIGAITEMLDHAENSPCVLFDEIPGYPAGRRVIVNCSGNPARQAITLNLPPEVLSILGRSGGYRVGAAFGAIVKRPSSVFDLLNLREQAHRSADRLAQVLPALLAKLD